MALHVIDVYHGNALATVNAAILTVDGVIAKASESTSPDVAKNPAQSSHASTVAAARKAKKLVGHYHFGWLGQPVAAQVAEFVKAAGALPGEILALDYESEHGAGTTQWPASVAARLAWVLEFTAAVSKATGAHCALYCNKTDWADLIKVSTPTQKAALLKIPLWIAAPSDPAGKPGIKEVWALQQTGVSGGLDRDVADITAAQWRAIGVPAPVKPAPAPAPVKPAPVPAKPVAKPVVTPVPVKPAPAPATSDPSKLLAALNLSTYTRSVIRTVTPAIVGQIVSWLLVAHIALTSSEQTTVSAWVGVVLGGIYYAGVRGAEKKWPRIGWLLGVIGAPTYGTPTK